MPPWATSWSSAGWAGLLAFAVIFGAWQIWAQPPLFALAYALVGIGAGTVLFRVSRHGGAALGARRSSSWRVLGAVSRHG